MTEGSPPKRRNWLRGWRWRLLAVYLALVVASHFVRVIQNRDQSAARLDAAVIAQAVEGDRHLPESVRITYREYRPEGNENHPTVLLIHGSPGQKNNFNALAPELARTCRVIVPDLPGFGNSTKEIPDYSIRAHADYLLQLMDALNVRRAHVIGFSMGGGVALHLVDMAPDRFASLTLLSAIGAQEMELLGDYHLNHILHGMQWVGMWLLREAVPDFGLLKKQFITISYARNFYDTDQRPLRAIMARYEGPVLIIHGKSDVLVPVEAALEHHRLLPQSELQLYDDDHFMVFTRGPMLADRLAEFVKGVEEGRGVIRANADPLRVVQAGEAFDPTHTPKAMGVTAIVMIALLAAATLVSEDLTCIGAGILVAQGRIDFLLGAFACFFGIFVGDLLLFFAGRYFGRPVLKRAPLKWFIRARDVEKSSAWFSRRGLAVIFSSRFVPGARLPTYFAAGLLDTRFWWFALYFLLAGVVWAPLLVGLSDLLGGEVIKSALIQKQSLFIKALAAAVTVFVIAKLIIRLSSYKGRRLLLSTWRRLTRWEFWPAWIFYLPVIGYVIFLAFKYRSLTLFTSANPAILGGGFVGESKIDILQSLNGSGDLLARASLIESALGVEERLSRSRTFMTDHQLRFPVVLKPNMGQRGSGVAVVRSEDELQGYLSRSSVDTIIQEYVPGYEFGVFYYRRPTEAQGRVFSITEKRFPIVRGDGESTLERLILKDPRAVCMARFYLDKQSERLLEKPASGEAVQLVELGTHCRGAIFLDGRWAKTAQLEKTFDEISKGFEGFYFGRFDVRTPSIEDFKQGRNFKIIELNGVTSEATHIYDPQNSLWAAYRVLFEQWRLAFEIGAENRRRGVKPTSIRKLVKLMSEYRQSAQFHLA